MEPSFGSLETRLKRNTAEVSIEMKMSFIDLLDMVGCLCILGYTSWGADVNMYREVTSTF
jgi:hypothetical protein